MPGHEYWFQTFLSTPIEVAALFLSVAVFGVAGFWYNDSNDSLAVVAGTFLLVISLVILGPRVAGEWHYWLGGGVVGAVAIMVVDSRRG